MPGPVNSIGPFSFLSIVGNPPVIGQELEIVRRPGVNGVGLWKTGFRGRPFRLRTQVDAFNKADARLALRNYQTLCGANPVGVVWSGLMLSVGEQTNFAVLDVQAVDIRSLANATGGLFPPSLGWIEADWTLIPIAAS